MKHSRIVNQLECVNVRAGNVFIEMDFRTAIAAEVKSEFIVFITRTMFNFGNRFPV